MPCSTARRAKAPLFIRGVDEEINRPPQEFNELVIIFVEAAKVGQWLVIDLLTGTFMLRLLEPDLVNLKKRLVKSPKIYLRDSGILHALLAIRSQEDLFGHPCIGVSFEGFAMENLIAAAGGYSPSFYRTSAGAEIDLVLRAGRQTVAFEFKSATVPKVSKGFWNALDDVQPDEAYVVAPIDEPRPLKRGVMVLPLEQAIARVALPDR